MVLRLTVREYDVVIEQDEDGLYLASVPALPGCHTQAGSLDELLHRTREAVELCLEARDDEGPPNLRFVGIQRLAIDI